MKEIANGIRAGDLVSCQYYRERLFSPKDDSIVGHASLSDTFLVTKGPTSNFFQSHVEVLHLTLGRVMINAACLEVVNESR
jgi:hypothetical protein